VLADGAASLDVASSIALFGSGEAAMMYPAGNFLTKTLTEAAGGKFEYDLFPFPALAGSGETRATGGPAVIWSVPKKSDNRAGAKELIKYFTDAETNTALVKADFIPASPTDPSSNQQQLYQRMVSFQESAATRAIFVPEVYTELLNSMSAMLGGSAARRTSSSRCRAPARGRRASCTSAEPLERSSSRPGVGLLLVVLLVPVLAALGLAFTSWTGFDLSQIAWAGADNFRELGDDDVFPKAFRNTLIFVVATTVLLNALGLAAALAINSRVRGHELLRIAMFLPLGLRRSSLESCGSSCWAPTASSTAS
jgi:ABC-type glycerol-3-phosphate transport system permease component